MRYFLIFNPASRQGRNKKKWEEILFLLKKKRVVFEYRITQRPQDATDFSSQAAEEGWDAIIAVGGDGTICEVISGLFLCEESYPKPKLGVLHIGTSPDFNRYHNIPVNLNRAIDTLLEAKSKLIDVGRITYMKTPTERNVAYFGSNVNVGIGPLIANKANARHRKYLGDFLGTLWATLSSLLHFKGLNLRIKIDGRRIDSDTLINLTVGKDPYLASGMRVFNDISPDDGKLYILSIKKAPFFSYLLNIPKLYIGDFLKFKGACIDYGKEIEIDCDGNNSFVEFDGDLMGFLPAKINVIPRALEVIVG